LRRYVTLQTSVDVSGACDLELLKAIRQRQFCCNLFRNLARRLAQPLGQFEWQRHRKLAHFHRGRLVDDNVSQLDLVFLAQEGTYYIGELLLRFEVHGGSSFSLLFFSVCSVSLW